MPVCNKKSFFVAGFFSLFCSLIGAQSVQMPAMPEMPEISAPELGGSFYRPSIPYSPTTKKTTEKNKIITKSEKGYIISDIRTTVLRGRFLVRRYKGVPSYYTYTKYKY